MWTEAVVVALAGIVTLVIALGPVEGVALAEIDADGVVSACASVLLHPRLGAPIRRALGKGASLIPSAKKRGAAGATFDIPLGHKDAAYVRSHFDGMEVHVSDAPRENEIVIAVAITDSGRPHARVGGLQKNEIKGEDGLR